MAKDKRDKQDKKEKRDKDRKDKHGVADLDAWDAARKVAKAVRKESEGDGWSRLPWREIRHQLCRTTTIVDMTNVPPTWTSESPQMAAMCEILERAGFRKDGHIYRWEQ